MAARFSSRAGARSCKNRQLGSDFWKFWAGQTISTLGNAVTNFALPLLIFQLTGSPLNLALTTAVSVLPYPLFGLVIGA
jgi:hypothetical protein